jgi:hypothetical protein
MVASNSLTAPDIPKRCVAHLTHREVGVSPAMPVFVPAFFVAKRKSPWNM